MRELDQLSNLILYHINHLQLMDDQLMQNEREFDEFVLFLKYILQGKKKKILVKLQIE